MKVGEVVRMSIYRFTDGTFTFHTAFGADELNINGQRGTGTTFRVKMSDWPSTHARENSISYKLLMNSTEKEISEWLANNPEHELKEVKPLP